MATEKLWQGAEDRWKNGTVWDQASSEVQFPANDRHGVHLSTEMRCSSPVLGHTEGGTERDIWILLKWQQSDWVGCAKDSKRGKESVIKLHVQGYPCWWVASALHVKAIASPGHRNHGPARADASEKSKRALFSPPFHRSSHVSEQFIQDSQKVSYGLF